MDVTEECFNQRPLRFAGNSQFIEDNLSKKRTEIPAIRTTNGTFPAGSEWTRNPVSAAAPFASSVGSSTKRLHRSRPA